MSISPEALADLRAALADLRPYAGLREWRPNRERGEFGVGEDFVEALDRQFGESFVSLRARGRGADPPDLEAMDVSGRSVGIEVTEIVDVIAIKRCIAAKVHEHANWDAPKLGEHIKQALLRKAQIELNGGPYEECILVLFTNEYLLDFDRVERWLREETFAQPMAFSRAFLSLDYQPGQGYPLVPVRWA